MKLENRLNALCKIGEFLDAYLCGIPNKNLVLTPDDYKWFEHQINLASSLNPWFTDKSIQLALQSWCNALTKANIYKWVENYKSDFAIQKQSKTIGVVMAGNIPMVGFHDFLSVLISGHQFLGKLSSDDKILIPAFAEILVKIEPAFKDQIKFTQGQLKDFNAIIATGSNNTARYFEYYFGKYPNIIRKNRNGVGVITGNERANELALLGNDIFSYFGLGCRNVSKLYVPNNYDFNSLFSAFENYSDVAVNHKYVNNYDYNKSIYLVNKEDHFDNGFVLLKNDDAMVSPISVIFYEYYNDLKELNVKLNNSENQIQCIVSNSNEIDNRIDFGKTQQPELWDYADGIDTLNFLLHLQSEKKAIKT
jgi:hypothetical protein